MKSNKEIGVTRHAVDRFIQRWEFAGKDNADRRRVRDAALMVIRQMWREASYVSDNSQGVRFRNQEFDCEMIVCKKTLVTLYKIDSIAAQPDNYSGTELRLKENNSRFRNNSKR